MIPPIIILIILILYLGVRINIEKFTSTYKIIVSGSDSLTNKIQINGQDATDKFYHLYEHFGKNYFTQEDYNGGLVRPILTFESYRECPVLYNLYKGLSNESNQIENLEGLRFRSQVQSLFYNIDGDIEVDYPIIDLKTEESTDKKNKPEIYFYIKNDSMKNIKYLDDGYKFSQKEVTFGVQEIFTILDLLKFLDFCFTTITWAAVHIDLLKLVDNHFYVMECQNPQCNATKKRFYYQLPVRLHLQCLEQGKTYTRAKCNNCCSNIVVYFDSLPSKFANIDYISPTPSPSFHNLIK